MVRVTGSIASLGEELAHLKDVMIEAAHKQTGESLGPKLDAVALAVGRRPPSELGPKLDALVAATSKLDTLRDAVLKLGQTLSKSAAPPVDLTPWLAKLSEAVRPAAPPVDLTPWLEKLSEILRPAAPPVDLTPWLAKLSEAVRPAAAPDLTPVLERLAEALGTRAASPSVDLGPVLQQLAQQARSSESEGTFREEVAVQMLLIQERLSELALAARTVLQNDSEGSVKAMTVWQQTKEALELLKALPSRGRKGRERG